MGSNCDKTLANRSLCYIGMKRQLIARLIDHFNHPVSSMSTSLVTGMGIILKSLPVLMVLRAALCTEIYTHVVNDNLTLT